LRTKPEPEVAEFVLNAQPFPCQRTYHDKDERAEKNVDAQALALGLRLADRGRDVEAGSEPRRGDPEQTDLQMPGARDAVRQPTVQRDPIEACTFHSVVRGDGAESHLDDP